MAFFILCPFAETLTLRLVARRVSRHERHEHITQRTPRVFTLRALRERVSRHERHEKYTPRSLRVLSLRALREIIIFLQQSKLFLPCFSCFEILVPSTMAKMKHATSADET